MFKIGEFSKLTQVSIRMLRYYDETGLLKPAKIDPFTGYRFYSVEQIPILHKIIFLRDTGFNVAEILDALHNWDDNFITQQLINKKQSIQELMKQEQEKINKIDIAIHDICQQKIGIHCNVVLKNIPSYKVLSLRRTIPNYFCEGLLWQELSAYVTKEELSIPRDTIEFAIYHDSDYKETEVDVEVCIVVKKIGKNKSSYRYRETEQIDTMACAMVYGPFENIASAYLSFAHWLMQHKQYRMIGQNRQICHRGPWNEVDPDNYLTEIQIPVESC
ncbi:MerR family transcriptional regulator [Anaerosacchariphilus polymeriproducens]|uniref:MerR family transcriptional regulator n=1 Tax=Anaerosacchariphilus polymeriproducens TaxID=1812858 RepID=A0A371AX04_9FIRM|nr:MerR family transcriptional regulator [Anaerosacchariphilus polymeriproducens]RDU24042.1 MerR family transcriptional regulator [Anaerosacchariphilus polymeriproducens]